MKTRITQILENLVKKSKLKVDVNGKNFNLKKDDTIIYTVASTEFGIQVTMNGKYKLDLDSKEDLKEIFR